jgi:hypothetical protein
MPTITHSFIVSVVESYKIAARQIRWLARILPDNWELIFIDDGSNPPIPIPEETPRNFVLLRTGEIRAPGEWTQHLAINSAVKLARGEYILKSDIDHIFTPSAISTADRFEGDMMLFNRWVGLLKEDFPELFIERLTIEVPSPVDDIYLIRKELFVSLGGYPEQLEGENLTRHYGGGGCFLWPYSRKAEAQPPADALIYVIPDTHETFHSLPRVKASEYKAAV